jgi:hypothetical protein
LPKTTVRYTKKLGEEKRTENKNSYHCAPSGDAEKSMQINKECG